VAPLANLLLDLSPAILYHSHDRREVRDDDQQPAPAEIELIKHRIAASAPEYDALGHPERAAWPWLSTGNAIRQDHG
jgi:hypothetical protein